MNTLQKSLDHPSSDVRAYSLRKIEQYQVQSAFEKVRDLYVSEKDPKILSAACQALGAIAPPDQHTLFQKRMLDPDPDIAGSHLIAILKYGNEEEKKQAEELLIQKVHSHHQVDQIVAARTLKQIAPAIKGDLLLTLLHSPHPEVVLAACEASAHFEDERLFPSLIEYLDHPHTYPAAFSSLASLWSIFD